MAGFSLTDSVGNPVDVSQVNWTSASSLAAYAKSESLHFVVLPDYVARKDQSLTDAAPKPLKFELSVGESFQLGGTNPAVSIAPGAKAVLRVNTSAGDNLFGDDDFHAPTVIPDKTGYVGVALTGSVGAGPSFTSGDLTFGINQNTSITFEYFKAFAIDSNQPTLGAATKQTLADFVIPAGIADLQKLAVNDVCAVTGQGCLKVCGAASVSLPVNPLASVSLPLNAGTLKVQDGLVTNLTSTFTVTGSYQVRVEKTKSGAILLSYIRKRDSSFEVDAGASAGVSVDLGDTDLLAKVLGGLEKGGVDPKVIASLSKDDADDFKDAVKSGLDHSLAASLTLAMSAELDREIAFQFELRPEAFDDASTAAVTQALRGDLTLLNASEAAVKSDGILMAGVKLLNSLTSDANKRGASLKINLLGIVNLITMSELLSKCEFLFEPASGDLTIKETAQSERISAITDPPRKAAALQKALFDSVLTTTTYVTGRTVAMPTLSCEAVHFTANRNTDAKSMGNYTEWLVVLHLMTPEERSAVLARFTGGGECRCTLRVRLSDSAGEALFFDAPGALRQKSAYREIGRQAMKALLDTDNPVDRARFQILDNPATWTKAMEIGPNPELATVIPVASTDPSFPMILATVTGDVYDIAWWADSMEKAAGALQQMRTWLAGRDAASLGSDAQFARQRKKLQQAMVDMVRNSRMRFDEPWGLVCLFQTARQAGASGQLVARGVAIDRSSAPALGAGGAMRGD